MDPISDAMELGVQTTVGGIIKLLFPNGYMGQDYIKLGLEFGYNEFDEKTYTDYSQEDIKRFLKQSGLETEFHPDDSEVLDAIELSINEFEKDVIDEYKKNSSNIIKNTSKKFTKSGVNIPDTDKKYFSLPFTPFDVFAISATLLQRSGAYHHIEANRDGFNKGVSRASRIVCVTEEDRKRWKLLGNKWKDSLGHYSPVSLNSSDVGIPKGLLKIWRRLILNWNHKIFQPIRVSEDPPSWWKDALALLAVSDIASAGVGFRALNSAPIQQTNGTRAGYWAYFAYRLLKYRSRESRQEQKKRQALDQDNTTLVNVADRVDNPSKHTLSYANRDIASVLPKSRTSQIGCTLRSLTHNLAFLPPRGLVRATWSWLPTNYTSLNPIGRRPFNIVIIPTPFSVSASSFIPTSVDRGPRKWGTFSFSPEFDKNKCPCTSNIVQLTKDVIDRAREEVGTIHALIYPELSLTAEEFDDILDYAVGHTNLELVCAGLRERYHATEHRTRGSTSSILPSNEAVMASLPRLSEEELTYKTPRSRQMALTVHQKHHRWKLTEDQIKSYGLSSSLDPSINWWEDLRILSRRLPFMVMRDRWTVTTLICEDLARVDPAQEMVRAIGPNLCIALVMDGPQLTSRWSARYATVLADDPGGSVLTVNSLGLMKRSERIRLIEGKAPSNSRPIALWKDDIYGVKMIDLPKEHHAVCLTVYETRKEEFTLDGRGDNNRSTGLYLGNYFSIKVRGSQFEYE